MGRTKHTVRKWAYELRDRGLLSFGPGYAHDKKEQSTRTEGAPRNDRNVFYLSDFEKFLVKESARLAAEESAAKAARKKGRRNKA